MEACIICTYPEQRKSFWLAVHMLIEIWRSSRTGVCLAEAALVISREKTFAHETGGGLLTPATLGEPYLDRLQKAGLSSEFRIMP